MLGQLSRGLQVDSHRDELRAHRPEDHSIEPTTEPVALVDLSTLGQPVHSLDDVGNAGAPRLARNLHLHRGVRHDVPDVGALIAILGDDPELIAGEPVANWHNPATSGLAPSRLEQRERPGRDADVDRDSDDGIDDPPVEPVCNTDLSPRHRRECSAHSTAAPLREIGTYSSVQA